MHKMLRLFFFTQDLLSLYSTVTQVRPFVFHFLALVKRDEHAPQPDLRSDL